MIGKVYIESRFNKGTSLGNYTVLIERSFYTMLYKKYDIEAASKNALVITAINDAIKMFAVPSEITVYTTAPWGATDVVDKNNSIKDVVANTKINYELKNEMIKLLKEGNHTFNPLLEKDLNI